MDNIPGSLRTILEFNQKRSDAEVGYECFSGSVDLSGKFILEGSS